MEGSKSSSTTMQVSFVCQRCNQPLKLDTSFNVLDRLTIQELIGTPETSVPTPSHHSEGIRPVPVIIPRYRCSCLIFSRGFSL